jgi:2-polyprenyl-3-methyl-5-hydroxy-6-metoxy-1,4-benzoquinol methylase
MRYTNHLTDYTRWRYLLRGCVKRLTQRKRCPCCGEVASTTIDRKLVYRLERCQRCGVRYRYPYETSAEIQAYYQQDFSNNEKNLTGGIPDAATLQHLRETNFTGTELDFSGVLQLLHLLNLRPGARVFDYGASWGYGIMQLQRAGFAAAGLEISAPRVQYGKSLGLELLEQLPLPARRGSYDAIYSSHVLEHLPDAGMALRQQLELLRPGGLLIAHTPNGSDAFRMAIPWAFHRSWGLPHPILLSDDYIKTTLAAYPCFVSSTDGHRGVDPALGRWDRLHDFTGDLSHTELLLVICNVPKGAARG